MQVKVLSVSLLSILQNLIAFPLDHHELLSDNFLGPAEAAPNRCCHADDKEALEDCEHDKEGLERKYVCH